VAYRYRSILVITSHEHGSDATDLVILGLLLRIDGLDLLFLYRFLSESGLYWCLLPLRCGFCKTFDRGVQALHHGDQLINLGIVLLAMRVDLLQPLLCPCFGVSHHLLGSLGAVLQHGRDLARHLVRDRALNVRVLQCLLQRVRQRSLQLPADRCVHVSGQVSGQDLAKLLFNDLADRISDVRNDFLVDALVDDAVKRPLHVLSLPGGRQLARAPNTPKAWSTYQSTAHQAQHRILLRSSSGIRHALVVVEALVEKVKLFDQHGRDGRR